MVWKDTCNPMFVAALFTIAKTWKQPKCPLTDKWLKKMWYVYTKEYYSAKKNEIMLFVAIQMNLETVTLRRVSQTVRPRKRIIIWYCLQAEPKWHKWAYLENEQTHRLRQGTYQGRRMPGEKDGGRDSYGVWDGHGPLLYLKWVTNKDPPDVTGNSAQCRVALHRRGVWGRMDTCIHMAESLCSAPETITRLLISCTPI